MNRIFLCLVSFVVILSFISCKNQHDKNTAIKEDQSRPNIILIMADDQGWGDVGYNDHPYLKTPNLDAMAENGVRFNRFYAASSVCSPTRGSVMTGRHPLRYGICTANCGHIKKEEITLAEMLKEKGYNTGHFGKWHLGTLTKDIKDANRGGRPENDQHYAPPWEHGFDTCFVTESKVPTWNPMLTPNKGAGDVRSSLAEGESFETYYWTGPGEIVTDNLEGDDSRIIMDRVIPFIKNATKTQQPFLSIIWFHTPHLPVLTGEANRLQYKSLSDDQQHYYGVISALDEQVGRLRTELKNLGIADNTILFYTSDNGPEGKAVLGRTQGDTKGLKGRKRSLNEGGIRVPGIMEWPQNIKPGTVVENPCFTSDYFPTIAKIVGIDLAKYQRPYDGTDLLQFINQEEIARTKPLAFEFQKQAALIDEQDKIYRKNPNSSFELYDIVIDPAERNNLADSNPEKLKELVVKWNKWKESQVQSAEGRDY